MALPDFLLLGAPKCGTSALHKALQGHPQLFLPEVKEPKFFLTDGPPPTSGGGPGDVPTWGEHVWRRADYEALFDPAPPGALTGEGTVFYLYDTDAQQRIRDLVPDAKLIAVLRDPVERAHSNWSHLREAGLEPEADFLTACRLEDERRAAGWAHFWHYVAQGRYGDQVEALYSRFDPEQVLLLRYRSLRDSPICTADRVCAFLGVETGVVRGVPRHHVRPDVHGRSAGLSPDERAEALGWFADDVARLEKITGWDLGDWRS
ncbi:sulfotransferase family protein [Actinomycetospora chiangmaiensis]|uniref:sulfotransferase family protein n=1 Tax=Actinomycetospora chiangmaiensis TaxID=402650 RepID=UPI0003611217|nr:sulfotransferase [Actinomycetospora chiangmaiensis]